MDKALGKRSEQVMSLAEAHARRLNHDYVGTEHILLGLMSEPSGQIADLLSSLGADPARTELEIEKLIARGAQPSSVAVVPLTPRAKVVIDLARQEASVLSQKFVEPEHLLLGLMRQDDGVAARALRNMGLDSRQTAHLAVKDRLEQMRIIERLIRPVRTGVARKRKMREEFLSHLDGLFEEECAQLHDRPAALATAARRFGNPAELAAELDRAVSWRDRGAFYVERWIGWQAPESVLRYVTRVSAVSFVILAVILVPLLVVNLALRGWDKESADALRVVAALLLLMPAAQFGTGLSYFKMRDALWGVFGSRRSSFKAFLFAGCNALVVILAGFGFIAMESWNLALPPYQALVICGVAILSAVAYALLARFRGPTEIRDTAWVCLKIDGDGRQIAG
jgi:hypothetical protein